MSTSTQRPLFARRQRNLVEVDTSQYTSSTVTLSWTWCASENEVELVHCKIELAKNASPIPINHLYIDGAKLPGKSGRLLWAGSATIPSQEAVHWYIRALGGDWEVPQAIYDRKGKPPRFRKLSPFATEPVWPEIALLTKRTPVFPNVSNDLECPFLHFALPEESNPSTNWSAEERKVAASLLEEPLQLNLAEAEHLWESICLLAPNPYLSGLSLSFSTDSTTGEKVAALAVKPEGHLFPTGLTAYIVEEREVTTRTIGCFPIDSPVTILPFSDLQGAVGISIWDRDGNLVFQRRASALVQEIKVGVDAVRSRRIVKVESERKGSVTITTDAVQKVSEFTVKPKKVSDKSSCTQLLRKASKKKAERALQDDLTQAIFSEDWSRGQDALRRLLSRARRDVLLIDYFLSSAELPYLLPAIGSLDAKIRILVSKDGLRKIASGQIHPERPRSSWQYQALDLQRVADDIALQLKAQHAEIRLMTGNHPVVHDRFLVVDGTTHLIGSSVNEFGRRASMLIRLQATDTAKSILETAWNDAVPTSEVHADAPPARGTLRSRLCRLSRFLRRCFPCKTKENR